MNRLNRRFAIKSLNRILSAGDAERREASSAAGVVRRAEGGEVRRAREGEEGEKREGRGERGEGQAGREGTRGSLGEGNLHEVGSGARRRAGENEGEVGDGTQSSARRKKLR